jgi:hypothetical protein
MIEPGKRCVIVQLFDAFSIEEFNAQRSTSNAERSIQTLGRWVFGVRRSAFSFP